MTTCVTTTPYPGLHGYSATDLEEFGRGYLPGWLGIELVTATPDRLLARVPVRRELLGPHGFVHGGTLVAIADSLCGYGTILNLPAGATGLLTAELKTNFVGSLRSGVVVGEATPVHLGRTTQVWDAVLTEEASGRRLAIFRCTQLVLGDRD